MRLSPRGIEKNGFFHLRECVIEILVTAQGVTQKDVRFHVRRVFLQNLLGPSARVLELPDRQEQVAGLDLELDVVWFQY